jgi:hypothetical protein
VRPALAWARAIFASAVGVPAKSSARRTWGPLGAAPSTGARWPAARCRSCWWRPG